jgi:hypothetical protein
MLELGKSKRSLRRGVVASVFASHRIAKHRIAIPGGQLAAAVARRPSRSKEAAVTVRRASRLGNSRRRPPSNGIDFAASPPHAPSSSSSRIACWSSGKGKALRSNSRSEVQLPPAYALKPAQSVVVQHPKVGRGVTDVVVVGLVALLLSPRRRRGVQRPKVGRAGIHVGLGFVALLLSPRQRDIVALQGVPVVTPRHSPLPGAPFPPSTRKGPFAIQGSPL